MQHDTSLDNIHLAASCATIGSFDGVHRGHQTILSSLALTAHAVGLPAVAITFFPHPAIVLGKIQSPFYLTSPDERAALIGTTGVDYVLTITFDHHLAALDAREFMLLLSSHLGLRTLWVGQNFALGRNRSGNITSLSQLGQQFGYQLQVIDPVLSEGEVISSSMIRSHLGKGDVRTAAMMLGRWYSLPGRVVHGDGRGRGLGIPTANLDVWQERLLPLPGVYATRAWVGENCFASVTNIGYRPTFENQAPLPRIETHLFDYNGDLYGEELRLELIDFLRPEQRFSNVSILLDQISVDIHQAHEVLKHAPQTPDLPS
jgi:riboflavin kinase / FMN adenylyltransferase